MRRSEDRRNTRTSSQDPIAGASQSFLYVMRRELLFIAPELVTDECTLCAGYLIVGMNGPIRVQHRGQRTPEVPAVLVAPGTQARLLTAPGATAVVYAFDADTPAFALLAATWQQRAVIPLPDQDLEGVLHSHLAEPPEALEACDARKLADALVRSAAKAGGWPALKHEPRISTALKTLRAAAPETLPASALAARAGLSTDRFRHLFREQVGISPRRHQLWLKVRRALWEAASASQVTEVAPAAGFSDAAHLSRTIHKVFGLWPERFLRRGGVRHRRVEEPPQFIELD